MAGEARGEVRRKEKVVEGVGRWAEHRPEEYRHSEEPGRKAKKEWSEMEEGALEERIEQWKRTATWDAAQRISFKVKSKAAPMFSVFLSVRASFQAFLENVLTLKEH